jgi:glutamate dehydrogenase
MPARNDHGSVRLKLYHRDGAVPLSARLPLLENMGLKALDENTYIVHPRQPDNGYHQVNIHEVALEAHDGSAIPEALYPALEDCFMAVWTGRADSDKLNGLGAGRRHDAGDRSSRSGRAPATCASSGFPTP